MGVSAFLQGDVSQAEFYYNKSADFALASGEDRFIMLSIINLSRIYVIQDNFEKAEKAIDEYIDFMLKDAAMKRLAAAYGLKGQLYLDQGKNEKAIEYFTQSMETGLTAGNMTSVANGYTNLAIAEYLSNDFQKSEQYFQLALAYRIKGKDKYYIAEGYYNLGDFYYRTSNLDSAILNYKNSLKIAEESNNLNGKEDALEQLNLIYDTLNQYGNQIATLKEMLVIQKELSNRQSYKAISALKLSYEHSKKVAINTGGIREDQLFSQVEEYQSIFDNWMWIVFICILAFSVFIYFFKRSSKT